jgi:molybdate transport system substrate-binding protein
MKSPPNRRGISSQATLAAGSLLVMFALIALLFFGPDARKANRSGDQLTVYCAAGIKGPVEAVAHEYEQEFGVSIQLQYGGSGTLLSNLRVAKSGDLYLAADESYVELAQEQDLIDEVFSLAQIRPVIAVAQGNPKAVESISDLTREDVRVGLANPDAASVGKLTKSILSESGEWSVLEQHTKVFKPTVNEIANDLKIGAIDAGIVWDSTLANYPSLMAISVPAFDKASQTVTISVLKSTKTAPAAIHFARYLAAKDRGLVEFERQGFQPVVGDQWADVPEITLFSGGVNRMAIQDTVARFEEREGVRVNVVYNGCGILVGMMKSGQRPDAYFACDESFMTDVADAFIDPLNVSETQIVMLVPKGNPRNLKTMKDLAQADLKLGVTNEEQSALGALTKKLFQEAGLYEGIEPNIQTRVPTADLLVNQMRTGSLDVAIVYQANTSQVRDHLDVVPLEHPAAKAVQPFAVGKAAKYPHLTKRLKQAITSAPSRLIFEDVGFTWRAEP